MCPSFASNAAFSLMRTLHMSLRSDTWSCRGRWVTWSMRNREKIGELWIDALLNKLYTFNLGKSLVACSSWKQSSRFLEESRRFSSCSLCSFCVGDSTYGPNVCKKWQYLHFSLPGLLTYSIMTILPICMSFACFMQSCRVLYSPHSYKTVNSYKVHAYAPNRL